MTAPKPTAFSRGVAAEETAARLLAEQGFAILARRVRTPRGEIDLIARREDLLLFVEVKARSGLRAAAESVLVRQRRRIAAAAEVWLAAHPEFAALDMRLDVVLLAPGRAPVHLPGAFEAD